jgi:hypothetical protein
MALAVVDSLETERLNRLLIEICRSLLQYSSESWPWTSAADEQVRKELMRMADEQRDVVAALSDLLAARGHNIDFGTYPTEYTSLHYVAVDFLLSRLIANQEAIVLECEATAGTADADDEAKPLLEDIVLSERKHLDELRTLSERQN